jgi:hypothetical protein
MDGLMDGCIYRWMGIKGEQRNVSFGSQCAVDKDSDSDMRKEVLNTHLKAIKRK